MHIDMFGGISIYNKETTYENAWEYIKEKEEDNVELIE